jgi:serine/threonine protein kinase
MSQLPVNSEFGSYHILRPIGGGGMAQIYLAKTKGLAGFEKLLALKVINQEYANEDRFIQMLIDEAKIAVGLSHVNIAQVFDLGQYNGIYYIAMEFVDGCDVLELVNGLHALGERVPIEAVCYIGRQMCSGLHYAHSRKDKSGMPLNIVHRDISPQNILVSRAGEVKVVDFGIAKAAGVSTRTQAGVIKGKVNYMAPEQALGQKVDNRTDVFASGIVVWEMLTSQMAYNADNMGKLLAAVRKAEIPPPSTVRPEIPPALDRIVMKALTASPGDRFLSAHQFQVELTKFLSATAPEYGGSNISLVIERVLSRKDGGSQSSEGSGSHLSKEDQIEDHYSLIFDVREEPQPARISIKTNRGDDIRELGEELIIGRAGELVVADARVSRQHARIYRQDHDYWVEDLQSSNGTYLNGQRIVSTQPLQGGDEIRVGNCTITYLAAITGADPMSGLAPSRPKLIVACNNRTTEQLLDRELDLVYKIQVGSFKLNGSSARVVRRDSQFWVEPADCRAPITINGDRATKPFVLRDGDSFELAGMRFTFDLS